MTLYSQDLRQRALAAYKETGHKSQVCKTFQIARTTLDAWIKLEQQTGDLQPKKRLVWGYNHTFTVWDDYKVFVQSTPFNTISDLIEPFQQRYSKSISYKVLREGLIRMGWTHKKRVSSIDKPAN